MKKTYLAPTVQVVHLMMQSHVLIGSINSNVGITGTGDTSYDINEDEIR